MANVKLARNLGQNDIRILELEPSEAREGKRIDVEGDVRDELVLAGLAHEGEDLGSGGLDLSDPEIRKKLEEKEVEMSLAAGLLQLQQERQQEEFQKYGDIERDMATERDQLRDQKRREGERLLQERRDEPPKGPEEQPREIFGGVFRAEGGSGGSDTGTNRERTMAKKTTMSRGPTEVETEEEQEETRRREQERRGQPGQPGQPQPGQPQPGQPTQPSQPRQPQGPVPGGPGRTGGGSSRK